MSHRILKTIAALGAGLILSACDNSPDQDQTDPTIDSVLLQKGADKQIGKYFVVSDGDTHKGVVFLRNVFTKENGDFCATYNAYATENGEGVRSKGSYNRTRCIPPSALPKP